MGMVWAKESSFVCIVCVYDVCMMCDLCMMCDVCVCMMCVVCVCRPGPRPLLSYVCSQRNSSHWKVCSITAPSLRHHCTITAPSPSGGQFVNEVIQLDQENHSHPQTIPVRYSKECAVLLKNTEVRPMQIMLVSNITAPSLHTISAQSLHHHCTVNFIFSTIIQFPPNPISTITAPPSFSGDGARPDGGG